MARSSFLCKLSQMIQSPLLSNWTATCLSKLGEVPESIQNSAHIPATVPGCIHTDLLAAQLIDDPYLDENEAELTWISHADWQYNSTFDVDAKTLSQSHVELCFDGLDTVATISLNGQVIAETQNMHRRYRFDVKSLLKATGNELTIVFRSPFAAMEENEKRYPGLPHVGHGDNTVVPNHNMLRKWPATPAGTGAPC